MVPAADGQPNICHKTSGRAARFFRIRNRISSDREWTFKSTRPHVPNIVRLQMGSKISVSRWDQISSACRRAARIVSFHVVVVGYVWTGCPNILDYQVNQIRLQMNSTSASGWFQVTSGPRWVSKYLQALNWHPDIFQASDEWLKN